jgi:hypothetical protein
MPIIFDTTYSEQSHPSSNAGVTFATIRRYVSQLINDSKEGVGSFTNSTKTIADTRRLEPDNELKGMFFQAYNDSLLEWDDVVTTSTTGSFTLSSALGEDVASVQYELHELPIGLYNSTIVLAYREIRDTCLSEYVDSSLTLSDDVMSGPTGMSHVYKIEIDAGSGFMVLNHNMYTTDPYAGKIIFTPSVANAFSDKPLRIWGYAKPADIDPTSTAEFDSPRANYLVYKAASMLLPSRPNWLESSDRFKMAQQWLAVAEQEKRSMSVRVQPNTKRLT